MLKEFWLKLVISVLAIGIVIGAIVVNMNTGEMRRGSISEKYGVETVDTESVEDGSFNSDVGFTVFCNSSIVIEGGKANILAQNNEINTSSCRVKLYADKNSNIMLYESDVMRPGYYIEYASIDKDLDSGEYAGKVVFEVLDDNSEIKSTATVNVDITIV